MTTAQQHLRLVQIQRLHEREAVAIVRWYFRPIAFPPARVCRWISRDAKLRAAKAGRKGRAK